MLFFVGLAVVFGSVLGGYLPHGNFAVLMQPFELLIIAGAATGGFLVSNPAPVIKGVLKNFSHVIKGTPYDKQSYVELLTLLFTMLRLAKSKGPLALEEHVENPDNSSIFKKFPTFEANHHAVTFLCDYLRMMTMGTENPYEIEALIDEEIDTHHAEQETIAQAVTTVSDGLPAFGIVAAVLGVITTMSYILEPPEILGGMIGGALVGTFLGILLAYGVIGPIGAALHDYADAETKYFQCIKAALIAHMQGHSPTIAIEFARKTLFSHERPTFAELEEAVSAVPLPT